MKYAFIFLSMAFLLNACSSNSHEEEHDITNPTLQFDKKAYIKSIVNEQDTLLAKSSGVRRAVHIKYGEGTDAPNKVLWDYRQQLKSGLQLTWTVALSKPSKGEILLNRYSYKNNDEVYNLSVNFLDIYNPSSRITKEYVPLETRPVKMNITNCYKLYHHNTWYYWLEGTVEGTYYNKENLEDTVNVKLAFGFI